MSNVQYFEHNNQKMAYVREGNGPTLLFLHGWGANSGTMVGLAQYMIPSFDCINVDLPGFGISPEPKKPWSVDDYADFVEAFLKSLHVEELRVIAHSFGGRIMLKLMSRSSFSSTFKKVLITGGAGMKPRRKPSFYVKKYTAKSLKAPFQILPSSLKDKGLGWLRTTPVWKMLGSSEYTVLSEVMRQTFVKTVTEFLEPCLPKITTETLLVWGENDDATPVYQAERINKGIKGSELIVLKNAGHYAFIDQKAQFLGIAQSFLSD